jgi:hypothetical protein
MPRGKLLERGDPTMDQISLRFLTLAVAAAAILSIALLPAEGFREEPLALLLLLLLAAGCGMRATHVSYLRIRVTVSDLFVFCALTAFAPMAAPLVALAGVAAAELGPSSRPLSLRTVFNLCAVPLSAATGAWVFVTLGGREALQLSEIMGRLLLSGLAYFAVNLGLVALAVHLETRRSILSTCLSFGPWTAVSCLTSLLLGAGLVLVFESLGPLGLALGVVATGPVAAYSEAHKQPAATGDGSFALGQQATVHQ